MAKSPWPTEAQLRKARQPYAISVGELVFAWNALHENLSEIFELAIKSPSRYMGTSIWHSTDSDFAQRKMLRAAVERAKHFSQTQRADILWILNRVDDTLRHNRNDAIHAHYIYIQNVPDTSRIIMMPDMASESPRAKSLSAKARSNLKQYLEENTQLADILTDYSSEIFSAILAPAVRSWPERPELPQAHRKKSQKV
jgi:hypothetical protein